MKFDFDRDLQFDSLTEKEKWENPKAASADWDGWL